MATHPARREWNWSEFARLPDDGNRYEVIDGELFGTPRPETPHQEAGARLFVELRGFANEYDLGKVLYAPLAVLLGDGDYLKPDIVFVRSDHLHYKTKRGIEGPPDLVIEILSPTTARQDRGVKRERYAHFGIPEYWIVDTDRRRIETHRLADPTRLPMVVTDRLSWQPVEGGPVLELNVAELLADLD